MGFFRRILDKLVADMKVTFSEVVIAIRKDDLGTCDNIFLSGLLYHIDDPYTFLEECYEFLVTDGIVRIDTYMHRQISAAIDVSQTQLNYLWTPRNIKAGMHRISRYCYN